MTDVERYAIPPIVALRLGLLTAGLFVVATNGFVIAGVLPEIARTLGTGPASVGYSVTAYAAVVAVGAPLISTFGARVPRPALMAAGLVLVAAGTAVAATAPGIGAFIAGRVVAGLGGAALVPAATAAAPALLPPELRGRALAIAALGFTLATAIGSPLGTALAAVAGWRAPLAVLAAAALVLGAATAVVVRRIPVPPRVGFGARFAVLADPRIVLVLVAAALVIASFNVVYLFSGAITGSSGSALAVLLLVLGVAGVGGTSLAGVLTDRWGANRTVVTGVVVEAVVFGALWVAGSVFAVDVAAFLLWGVGAFGLTVPLQHRLIAVDPDAAALTLSWYSTAMYVGIALAPVVGGAALAAGGRVVPLAGAAAVLLAGAAWAASSALRHRRRTPLPA